MTASRGKIILILVLCVAWLSVSTYLYFIAFHRGFTLYEKQMSRLAFETPRFDVKKGDVIVWEVRFGGTEGKAEIVEQFLRPYPGKPHSFEVEPRYNHYAASPARGEWTAPEDGKFRLSCEYVSDTFLYTYIKILYYPIHLKILFFASLIGGLLGILVPFVLVPRLTKTRKPQRR